MVLEFGDSGRSLDIASSVALEITDKEGHAFKVRRLESVNKGLLRKLVTIEINIKEESPNFEPLIRTFNLKSR